MRMMCNPKEPLNLVLNLGLPQITYSNKVVQRSPEKDAMVAHLLTIFPELCPNHATSCLDLLPDHIPPEQALLTVIESYLTHGISKSDLATHIMNPPTNNSSSFTNTIISSMKASTSSDDAFQSMEMDIPYLHWCLFQMASDFPFVKMVDLRRALQAHNGRLGPAYRAVYESYCLSSLLEVPDIDNDGEEKAKWSVNEVLQLMKQSRPALKYPPVMPCPIFEKEWKELQKTLWNTDIYLNQQHNSKDKSCDQEIECGCCYSDCKFEDMVQCADGHLFCIGCLRRHVEEQTFGSIRSNDLIPCMDTGGCMESFPCSEVRRALPTEVHLKYEQRKAEEAVAQANLQGLVYCPFCNYPWEIDLGMFVLECHNEACRKLSCIKCKEPSHDPLSCEEVEKSSETLRRKHVEEAMSKAFIRECSACKAEIVKTDGCNRVTCRCGQNMCYLCRQPIPANYDHFCPHTRDRSRVCTECNLCGVWDEEDDDTVIETAKETALKDIDNMDPNFVERLIGPPSDV